MLIERMERGELDMIYILDEPQYNNNWHKLAEQREEVVFRGLRLFGRGAAGDFPD